MTASRMEIGDHGGHHYGAIKAPVEEHPLLPPKSPKRASRRSLVVGGIVVLAFVLATQARRTTSVTTTTITSTEDGGSSREEENITERQQPVVNSNMARLEAHTSKERTSTTNALADSKGASIFPDEDSQANSIGRSILANILNEREDGNGTRGGNGTRSDSDSSRSDSDSSNEFIPTTLELIATNEYGQYDPLARSLYGLDMVIEPYKKTKITALCTVEHESDNTDFYWYMVEADDDGNPQDLDPEFMGVGGQSMDVTLTKPGSKFWMWVGEISTDTWDVIAQSIAVVSCKYVRRELRDLTGPDSSAFFKAMQRFYDVPMEEGTEMYGDRFVNSSVIAAYHALEGFCYTNGMQYLNAYSAFNLWAERSLQMIDPAVSLPYWDFTKDTAELGVEWTASSVFSPDKFGSAMGSAKNNYQLTGSLENASRLFDEETEFSEFFHNAYGFIDSPFNYDSSKNVSRAASYCDMEMGLEVGTCSVFVECFDDNETLEGWIACMEKEVQATHGMIGGGFNCEVRMDHFLADHKEYSRGLLSFTMGYIIAETWPDNSLMADFNECVERCDIGDTNCGCTCTTDPYVWPDEAVYEFMRPTMEALSTRAHGDKYVYIYNEEDSPDSPMFGFMQDGKPLSSAEEVKLLRQMMGIACKPGSLGSVAGAAAPADPIFYMLHGAMEKAFHVLKLSPSYKHDYSFEWVDSYCGDGVYGGGLFDILPFTEWYLGVGDSSAFLSNDALGAILDPTETPGLPYVYDKFQPWGACGLWDFDVSEC